MTNKIMAHPQAMIPEIKNAPAGSGVETTAILPGNLIEIDSTNGTVVISTADATDFGGAPYVALEKGSSEGYGIDDGYETEGETVKYAPIRSGEYAYVRATSGTNFSEGYPLTFNAGKVQNPTATDGSENIQFRGAEPAGTVASADDELYLVFRF